jgi:hypothetical protein
MLWVHLVSGQLLVMSRAVFTQCRGVPQVHLRSKISGFPQHGKRGLKWLYAIKTTLIFYLFSFLTGFDGGMNQTFHILVKEKGSELVKYDNSNLDKGGGQEDQTWHTLHTTIILYIVEFLSFYEFRVHAQLQRKYIQITWVLSRHLIIGFCKPEPCKIIHLHRKKDFFTVNKKFCCIAMVQFEAKYEIIF